MNRADNTLFLRLAGPMQAWGTSSRFQLRRSDTHPSRSGVLGLVLCAKGVRRDDSPAALAELAPLFMGVRVDRPGNSDWDYHTAGAKIGIRSADGKIKRTASTGEYETLLSRRQYLYDASFLVALQGPSHIISACVHALDDPVWPVFLGRKCCVPAEPVVAGTGFHGSVLDALSSVPWHPRIDAIDRSDRAPTLTLDAFIEHPPGSPPPDGARLAYDVPRAFGFYNHGARWIVATKVTVPVGKVTCKPAPTSGFRADPYGPQWERERQDRLQFDNYLCVFCKSPAIDVHHLDYADVRRGTLRSLCKICHDACTMLEYGHDTRRRIDPSDPEQRPVILQQVTRLLTERRQNRRRELLEVGRTFKAGFFDDVADLKAKEGC
jgi:CRISPR system Cascade subunit CasD